MDTMHKLQRGDEVRVIAPSRSAAILSADGIALATASLQEIGLRVTYGKHIFDCDMQQSSSIDARIDDLHEAFRDPNVKAILTVIGGFNSNELLPYIDYELLREHPKILCGYSDVTALVHAITAKSGLMTYIGPHFSSFQLRGLHTYQQDAFIQMMMQAKPFSLTASPQWSDDEWYIENAPRTYFEGQWCVYTEGVAEGRVFGGNLCTLNLLQGTPYMPNMSDCILFVEDDELSIPETFARDLTSLLQAIGPIRGLMIGRFQRKSGMTEELLHFILQKQPQLAGIPVMYNVDIGHTQPLLTLPIGGKVRMDTASRTLTFTEF